MEATGLKTPATESRSPDNENFPVCFLSTVDFIVPFTKATMSLDLMGKLPLFVHTNISNTSQGFERNAQTPNPKR